MRCGNEHGRRQLTSDKGVGTSVSQQTEVRKVGRAKAPRGKKELLGYFLALHTQLDKEFNYAAEELTAMSVFELKGFTKSLADHLLLTPMGEDAVDKAKKDALYAYDWLVRVGVRLI